MLRILLFFVVVILLSVPTVVCAFEVPEEYQDGIVVVHSDNMAPLSFLGLNREPKGFVIDYWRKWSQDTGVPVRFELMNWKNGLEHVRSHPDAIVGGLFQTDERLEFFDFSEEIFKIDAALFVMSGSDIVGMENIDRHLVGVLEDGAAQEFVKTNYPQVNLYAFPSVKELVRSFSEGDVDAVVMDYPTIMYQAGTLGTLKDVVMAEKMYSNYLRAGAAKGHHALLDLVERGMARVDAAEREHILERWFVADTESLSTLRIVVLLSLAGLGLALALLLFSGRRSQGKSEADE